MYAWQFEAIGTSWQVDTAEPLAASARSEVVGCIETFDQAWSRFRRDSLVTRMSGRAGTWTLPAEADQLLRFYAELGDATDGAVNPLVGQTLSDLGYDADYTLDASPSPADVPRWDSVAWEPPRLTTTAPVLLDVGAAGKGLLVDLVGGIVGQDTEQFTVDASGDLWHSGTTPVRVALEDPRDAARAVGVADLAPGHALCASATNRRTWGDGLHHVVDARTGRPTRDIVATWVVAGSCMCADGLATAHFFAEPAELMARFQHEYVRMHADGRIEWSPNFPGEVFV